MPALEKTQRELPQVFGKAQQPYSTLKNLESNDFAKKIEQLEKDQEGHMKMLLATIKNQNPEKPMKPETMMTTTSAMTQISVAIQTLYQLNKMGDQKAFNMANASQLQGQEVYYDDSTREFNGKPVEFNYEIKYPDSMPLDSKVKVNIKILNEKGIVVYSGRGKEAQGINSFVWEGKNIKGATVPDGTYKIEVTASADTGNGLSMPVTASAQLKGKVEYIVKDEDGVVKLSVNGKLIDPEKISKIANNDKSTEKASADDYVHYIGKKATIDLSILEVKGGKGEIKFDNIVANIGRIKVDILDKNSKFIKSIEYNVAVKPGINSIALDAKKNNLPDGEYRVKVSAEDKDNDNKMVALGSVDNIEVTGIDTVNGQVIAGDKRYGIKNISQVTGSSATDNSLITQGSHYIGKEVTYGDNKFSYNGNTHSFDALIASPAVGRKFGEAALVIYKGNEVVARVPKAVAGLVEKIPTFYELHRDSQTIIKNQMQQSYNQNEYANLDDVQKSTINNLIAIEFRKGTLFKPGQDANSTQDVKNKNMGKVTFEWDGALVDGQRAVVGGDKYSYKIVTSTVLDNDTDYKEQEVIPYAAASVREAKVEGGSLKLVLSNGLEISPDEIVEIKG